MPVVSSVSATDVLGYPVTSTVMSAESKIHVGGVCWDDEEWGGMQNDVEWLLGIWSDDAGWWRIKRDVEGRGVISKVMKEWCRMMKDRERCRIAWSNCEGCEGLMKVVKEGTRMRSDFQGCGGMMQDDAWWRKM
jgi:hypothetical protein